MIGAVLLAAAVLTMPATHAPARGDSTVELVHVSGWHRIVSAEYTSQWDFAPAAQDWAFTLPAGVAVEVRIGGSCTFDGVTRQSTMLQTAVCHGRGGGTP